MTDKEKINQFINTKKIAVAGASRNKKNFGNIVYRTLKKLGYKVYPVNPYAEEINGDSCFKSINELPDDTESIVILTNSLHSKKIYELSINRNITNIWIQKKSESKDLLTTIKNENNANIITNQCILMFAEPVQGVHKFHRFILNLFNKLPK